MTKALRRQSLFQRLPGQRVSGFTLLELLVVVAIIAVLTAIVGPRFFGQITKSEITAAKGQINVLEKAVDQFRIDTGRFPTNDEGLTVLTSRPQNAPKWNGPYLTKPIGNDPWGHPYVYRLAPAQGDFEILSYGKDGLPGGEGENADISNLGAN